MARGAVGTHDTNSVYQGLGGMKACVDTLGVLFQEVGGEILEGLVEVEGE
jgi:hypothetical protein